MARIMFAVAAVAVRLGLDLNLLFDPIHYLRLRVRQRGDPEHRPEVGRKNRSSGS